MTPAITVSNVTYKARQHFYTAPKTILNNLSFTVPEGSICGFVGANGAGKTTTLRMLLGQLKPTSGTLQLFGVPARCARARMGLGYLPERAPNPNTMSALTLVRTHGLLRGVPPAQVDRQAHMALSQVHLHKHSTRPIRDFSKGMLQRLGLAQALVGQPKLLVLDEPLSGLDPPGRHMVQELIRLLGQQGRTVFFSTHMLADVELLCDQVVVLREGGLLFAGAPTELHHHPQAHAKSFEVVGQNVDDTTCALAQNLGATCRQFGDHWRFILVDVAAANALAQAIVASGAVLKLLAPLGGSALEALLVAPQHHPAAPADGALDETR